MQNKVYLDFQIIDNCSKDERYRKHFLESSDNEYYLSVNHFEELYRAKKTLIQIKIKNMLITYFVL